MSISPVRPTKRGRRPTTVTASFGSGRREGHDASAFYQRFVPPDISAESGVNPPSAVDTIYAADARQMDGVASNSVALVVTSPPYFAGKQYEESLGVDGVPATYFEYLQLLRDVFAECKRVLEPGGRIAVNVANLGRRPYRSLSGDVTDILQELGLLLRGEVIWWKGRAAGGSCAWGTFQRPANPVLRDVTERIVIASKGRFDRALSPAERSAQGLPSTATISRDEFMEATTDLWEIPPESATKVGHPAPFPVELPTRLIELYSYEGDLILDPFLGSGSAAVAALRTRRHYLGFDTDAGYVAAAERRIAGERKRLAAPPSPAHLPFRVELPATLPPVGAEDSTDRRRPGGPAGEGPRPAAARVLRVRGHPGRREGAGAGHHGQFRGHRPDRRGVGLRRVGFLYVEPGGAPAHRCALEVAGQGRRAARGRIRPAHDPADHRRADPGYTRPPGPRGHAGPRPTGLRPGRAHEPAGPVEARVVRGRGPDALFRLNAAP